MSNENSMAYEHYVPMRPEDPTWKSKLNLHLVRSYEELEEIFKSNENPKYMAFDTETNGLNADVNHIVGFSFAFNATEGWYVPVRHLIGNNLPDKDTLLLFYNFLLTAGVVFEYNMRFDTRMMEKEGFDMSKVRYYDVQVGVFLADTNWKKTGLKLAERRWLGWTADTFEETLGSEANFAYLDPEDCYEYAAVDAVGTFGVCQKTLCFYKEARIAGRVTNEILYPFMKCEDNRLYMDIDYLRKCEMDTIQHLKELEHEIIQEVGYPFKINSNKQLGDALQSIGISTGRYTKGGQMKVDIESLETTNLKEPHSILDKLIDYSKTFKMYNSYILTLIKECEEHDNRLRFNFKACAAPCLTEDATVLLKDKGLVSIKECVEGDYIWTQWGWKKVVWNHSHVDKDIWSVRFKNGKVLTGTGHHPVLVNKGNTNKLNLEWAAIKSLKVGERVMVQHNELDLCNVSDEDAMRAQLYGFIDGDGSITDDRIVLCFNEEDKEMIEFYSNLFESLYYLEPHYQQDRPDHTVNISYFSTSLSRELSKELRNYENGVSNWIISRPELYPYYLAGIFDSDGNISRGKKRGGQFRPCRVTDSTGSRTYNSLKDACEAEGCSYSSTMCRISNHIKNPGKDGKFWEWIKVDKDNYSAQIRLKMTNLKLIEDVSLMLHSLGIENSVNQCPYYDRIGNRPQRVVNVIGRQAYHLFYKYISDKIICKSKRDILESTREFSHREYADTLVEEVWMDIESTVYDIEVEDVHEYIANGIVNHNTMRMAAGSDAKNDYFAKINVMAIPKPHPLDWYVHPYKEGDPIPEGDQVILNWRFSLTDKSKWKTESTNTNLNMRCAFLPDPGHYVVGMDYAAQELRMQANLANVKVWVDTFNTGGDLHKNMAIAMWGEENYDKEKRKKAKVLNFGMLYGMSAYTLAERFHVSLEEGQDIVNRYWKAVPEIQAYQKAMVRKAKKEGTTYNYFGGPRRMKFYFDSDDPKRRAFAVRTVGNNPIQSSCATMTQIAFLKVWQQLYSNPEWIDDCHFFSFIHDEILSSVKKERVKDFIKIQRVCMEKKFPNLPVTFTTSVAIGNSWGNMFEFKWTEDGDIVPDMEEVSEE